MSGLGVRGLVTAFRISWEDIKLHLQFIAIFAAVACPVLFVWVAANAHPSIRQLPLAVRYRRRAGNRDQEKLY